MINAGKYNKHIKIIKVTKTTDSEGFDELTESVILETYASVKTTKGYTLIQNDSDFEKATTNFTIRYPKTVITRDMLISYNENKYSIEYLNNMNENNIELEMQAKLIKK